MRAHAKETWTQLQPDIADPVSSIHPSLSPQDPSWFLPKSTWISTQLTLPSHRFSGHSLKSSMDT